MAKAKWVYLIYTSDGWGHSNLKRVASCYALACKWIGENGGKPSDVKAVSGLSHDPDDDNGPTEQLVAMEQRTGRHYRIEWHKIDADVKTS